MIDPAWTAQDATDAEVFIQQAQPTVSGDWSFWPLRVHWELIGVSQIRVTMFLAHAKVAEDIIDSHNAIWHFQHKSPASKVDLYIRLEHGHELWLEGDVCVPKLIGGWNCKDFKTQLARV